jgi:hypothetical protein
MNKNTLNKLLLSRSLYYMAKENVASASGIKLSIASNLLQDSVECFLLALSEHVGADVGLRTEFDKYFEQINLKIAPRKLPFKSRLIALNKLRVNSKHYGLEPARAELEPLLTTTWEFFDEVMRVDFGKEFATISLIDILRDGEAKKFLHDAELAYETQDYAKCLVDCRKALFVTLECHYDAQPFLNGRHGLGLLSFGSRVPYFAQDKKYIEEHVKEPTDYVIYEHNEIEMELMKNGVDSIAYWNVWRLTPKVYRKNGETLWVIKHDFRKLDTDGIKDRAEYVLLSTTEMLLAFDQNQSRTRSADYRRFYLTLKRDSVPVYSKASKLSTIEQTTAIGIRQLDCDFRVEGLDGSGAFWKVMHGAGNTYIYGFIHEEDIDN